MNLHDSSTSNQPYAGSELPIFEHALQWKRYFCSVLTPHLRSNVLEVGAGIGATTAILSAEHNGPWECLEPDPALAAEFERRRQKGEIPARCAMTVGTLEQISGGRTFGSIIYIDVLEHIADDSAELQKAAALLAEGGVVAVLSPAHQWLFTDFDSSIGHYRRYTKATLQKVVPQGLTPVFLGYLDSVGIAASLANRLLLRQSMPTLKQILFWDRNIIPLSRAIDRAAGFRVGKSVLGIWRKTASASRQ